MSCWIIVVFVKGRSVMESVDVSLHSESHDLIQSTTVTVTVYQSVPYSQSVSTYTAQSDSLSLNVLSTRPESN